MNRIDIRASRPFRLFGSILLAALHIFLLVQFAVALAQTEPENLLSVFLGLSLVLGLFVVASRISLNYIIETRLSINDTGISYRDPALSTKLVLIVSPSFRKFRLNCRSGTTAIRS